MSRLRRLYAPFAILVLVIAGLLFVFQRAEAPSVIAPADTETATTTESVATTSPISTVATTTVATSTPEKKGGSVASTTPKAKKASITAKKSSPSVATSSPNDILRVENPYPTPPLAFEAVNVAARGALVNIYCATPFVGTLKPVTGSGIMVDPRGIVLTNAHVAQYVLIAQTEKTDFECYVRSGAPAVRKWVPAVMYIPTTWINVHASEIGQSRVLGTGEHDFALLYMAKTTDGSPLPESFEAVRPDVREAIGFVDDSVLVASYPVEFVGGSVIQSELYPVTSITTIKQLLTFTVGKADAVSLGGVIGAQSGSSGGGIVNQWNRLIGLITTTSEGSTTDKRDLHAITTAYINRALITLTGKGFIETLAQDPKAATAAFKPTADALGDRLINVILGH